MSSNEPAAVEDNIPLVTLIQITRVYDVLMALLQEQNPEKAEVLYKIHEQGDIMTSAPALARQE